MEPLCILATVIRGNPDADDQHPRAGVARCLGHGFEVRAHDVDRQPAQAVIGAQFDDDDRRTVRGEQLRQPGHASARGLARDARVDDRILCAGSRVEALLKQPDPAGPARQTVLGRQAVAKHENRGGCRPGLRRSASAEQTAREAAYQRAAALIQTSIHLLASGKASGR